MYKKGTWDKDGEQRGSRRVGICRKRGRGIKMENRGGGAEVAVSLIKTVGKSSFLTSKHNWV